jgi:hypothetical protein
LPELSREPGVSHKKKRAEEPGENAIADFAQNASKTSWNGAPRRFPLGGVAKWLEPNLRVKNSLPRAFLRICMDSIQTE